MTKRLLALALVLLMTLPLCAQAASTGFQDIASYSNGAVRYGYKKETDTYRMKAYEALNGNGEAFAKDYVDLLTSYSMFNYIGAYDTGDWVHMCLESSYGYYFDTFRLTSYGKSLTPYSVVIVSYRPDSEDIYVRYSEDLSPTDQGYRSVYVPASVQPSGNGKVQDPATYSNGAVRYSDSRTTDDYRQKNYKVLSGDAQYFVNVYGNLLDSMSNLSFLGVYDTGNWVHHCFGAQSGYNYDTFRLTSNGEALTPYCVVIVSWKPDSSAVYVRYSNELTLTDLGYRY